LHHLLDTGLTGSFRATSLLRAATQPFRWGDTQPVTAGREREMMLVFHLFTFIKARGMPLNKTAHNQLKYNDFV